MALHSDSPSAPVPARERRQAGLDAEQRHAQALARCLGQPLSAGNRLRWADDALQELTTAVAQARRQVLLDQWLLLHTPGALQQALLGALRRGVQVAVRGGFHLLPGAELLRRAGAVTGQPVRWHRWWPQPRRALPLLLTDGRRALLAPGGPHGPGLVLDGPVVAALQQAFVQAWRSRLEPALPEAPRWAPPQLVTGSQRVALLPAGWLHSRQRLQAALVQALQSAQQRVSWDLGSGEPLSLALRRALQQAARRGVEVQLLAQQPSRALAPLQSAGARCRVLAPTDAAAPSRRATALRPAALPSCPSVMVVDGVWSAVGAPRLADAPMPLLLDAELGATLEQRFEQRFGAARA